MSTTYSIDLTQHQIDTIIGLLDAEIKKRKGIIKRARNYPSETIKSSQTIDRQQIAVEELQALESHFAETFQF